jgi:hypothetical protein
MLRPAAATLAREGETMTVKESLEQVLPTLTEQQQQEILDFAMFLSGKNEREEWRELGRQSLARAYGPNEPEYTEADIKPRRQP